jgi:hypothetical protein
MTARGCVSGAPDRRRAAKKAVGGGVAPVQHSRRRLRSSHRRRAGAVRRGADDWPVETRVGLPNVDPLRRPRHSPLLARQT